MVVHEVEGEKHNFWYVKELGYENCCSQPGTLFGLKEHEVQKHYDCSHIPQLQSYMWFVDTLSLFYVSSKVGSATLMREDSIIEFIAVLCHQLLIWVAQHPLSIRNPPRRQWADKLNRNVSLAVSWVNIEFSCSVTADTFCPDLPPLFKTHYLWSFCVKRWMHMWSVKLFEWPKMR